jgi:hypothetical protein
MKFTKFAIIAAIVVAIGGVAFSLIQKAGAFDASNMSFIGAISGNGEITNQARELAAFSRIDVSCAGKVTVKKGDAYRVDLTIDSNLLDTFVSKVTDSTLALGFAPGAFVMNMRSLEIVVTTPTLTGFKMSGAAEVVAEGFEAKDFTLELSGAGSFKGELSVETLAIHSSGAASIELSGRANSVSIDSSGASDIDMDSFTTKSCDIQSSGAGHVAIDAVETLDVKLSGIGSVEYLGSPEVTKEISGLGSVERIGD